jgi:hypothetical protein
MSRVVATVFSERRLSKESLKELKKPTNRIRPGGKGREREDRMTGCIAKGTR